MQVTSQSAGEGHSGKCRDETVLKDQEFHEAVVLVPTSRARSEWRLHGWPVLAGNSSGPRAHHTSPASSLVSAQRNHTTVYVCFSLNTYHRHCHVQSIKFTKKINNKNNNNPFHSRLSRTTEVSRYEKKHSLPHSLCLCGLFMVALCNRETIYIFMLWFVLLLLLLLLLFFSSPNLSRRRLDVCHTSTHGVALVRI